MNEAAIACAKDGRKFIEQEDISKSFIKVGIGKEKKSKIISEKDKKITAYHEAGHAILFHVLPDVTILRRKVYVLFHMFSIGRMMSIRS